MATTVDGSEGERWDVLAEIAVGQFIGRHLAACPPPPGSLVADDLERWAANLLHHGQVRLEAVGRGRLTLASTGAVA
jgi:hypothetical protein